MGHCQVLQIKIHRRSESLIVSATHVLAILWTKYFLTICMFSLRSKVNSGKDRHQSIPDRMKGVFSHRWIQHRFFKTSRAAQDVEEMHSRCTKNQNAETLACSTQSQTAHLTEQNPSIFRAKRRSKPMHCPCGLMAAEILGVSDPVDDSRSWQQRRLSFGCFPKLRGSRFSQSHDIFARSCWFQER